MGLPPRGPDRLRLWLEPTTTDAPVDIDRRIFENYQPLPAVDRPADRDAEVPRQQESAAQFGHALPAVDQQNGRADDEQAPL